MCFSRLRFGVSLTKRHDWLRSQSQ
uniref:Uncharacterized protein n=1 Tax=Anguilla anguilla TaxID=7936 RepID=A0A0E9QIW8_ANGAN